MKKLLIFLFAFSTQNLFNEIIYVSFSNKSQSDLKVMLRLHDEILDTIDLKKIKEILQTAVNDDMWYGGEYSLVKGFEQQKCKIEIYLDSQSPENPYIFFDKKIKSSAVTTDGQYYKPGEGYFYIGLYKDEGTGYTNALNISWPTTTSNEAKKEIKEAGGVFYQKDYIEFNKITKPIFPTMTPKRKKTIEYIEKNLPKVMKDFYSLDKGKYKAYIRNFRDNDYRTYVVIEDCNGVRGIIDYIINKKGISAVKYENIGGNDYLKYLANQYKKVAVSEKEIPIQ